ncbi:hypothetical protein [Rossellomorea aquimaris]|uniref:Uncharacterized protein n=1 Tax=Rossellomorea aquimaris TaxID=189382 RepID=A0A1J6W3R5_9BACI|nr:hypothetical protein [Rossellomorea aquimaris]OIU72814.1 hypothetical protein BHE18_02800 [Rossellomorea aquimaris]
MEKILVKTGVYTLIVSFFLFVIFFKREKEMEIDEEATMYEITPFPEFFFQIFRYSVIISIIGVVVAFLYIRYLKDEFYEKE